MPQYDELRGYETKDLWGSFHSHFTELWLEQTVLIWMVCPTNGLQSFITQGMPVDLVPRGNMQAIQVTRDSWCIDLIAWPWTVNVQGIF